MPASAARTFHDRFALVVLQLGAVAVVLAASPYKAFDLDRYFVPKELVLHVAAALSVLILLAKRPRISLSIADVALFGFLIASLVSAVLATNHWVAQRAFAVSLSGALLYWVASALRRAGLARPLLVALALGVIVCAATSLAQAYGVETEYFSLNRAPGGTLGNRNFIAHLCAIGLPVVGLVALTAPLGLGTLFGGAGMAGLAAALVMSRSRDAWLAVIALAVPMCILAFATRAGWTTARTRRRIVVLVLAAGGGAAAAVLVPNRLNWKSDNPYLESATGLVNYQAGSGRGRIVQYTSSLKLVEAHPVLGVGPGNWPVAYPKIAARNDASMSSTEDGLTSNPWPSSDWVGFASERGAVGLGLLFATFIAIAVSAIGALRSADAEETLAAIALAGTLTAMLVVGAFDAVLLTAVPSFFVWTLLGALAPARFGRWELGALARGALVLSALGCTTIAIARSVGQLVAIGLFSTTNRIATMDNSSRFDPGSYRIHVRVAAAYLARGDCVRARAHARAAQDLFPSAGDPKRLLASCGSK